MKSKTRYLSPEQAIWVRRWWAAIHPQERKDFSQPALRSLGRASRAQLRRCTTVDALLVEPATSVLAEALLRLEAEKTAPRFADEFGAIALVAGVLAGVRDDAGDGRSLAATVAAKGPKDPATLSELRFRRLLRTDDVDDFYRQLWRAVQLAGRKVDVAALADDVIAWCVEQRRPVDNPNLRIKARWARDYYLPAAAAATLANATDQAPAETLA